MKTFEPLYMKGITFKNRIIRSGTYEGSCDQEGFPLEGYYSLYENLAKNEVGGIITGFAYVSKGGRAMQPAQSGIDAPDKIPGFKKLTHLIHRYGCPVFIQIAHAGRQTVPGITGSAVRGVSEKRSVYFRSKPVPLSTDEVYDVINQFASSAEMAMEAGFDGVQIHAAHGYLIHQFLLAGINNRKDEFGLEHSGGIGSLFLEKIIESVRNRCGDDFPVIVKVSGGINNEKRFGINHFTSLIQVLDKLNVHAIEISYGTMDYAFNIFRGDLPSRLILKKNPFFMAKNLPRRVLNRGLIDLWFKPRLLPFSPSYNLLFAKLAKTITTIPVISVGGFRSVEEIEDAIASGGADMVSLSRPFVTEPDFVVKVKYNSDHLSACINCNKCAVMCDSGEQTKCYQQ